MTAPAMRKLAGKFSRLFMAGLLSFMLVFAPVSNVAADSGMSLIRDAEIEAYLADLGRPIFNAAGLPPENISLVLVASKDLNAFVAGGMNIFFYTGLLQAADTPLQLVGVLAHETGHIAGGHLARGSSAMRQASAQAILATILGVAAGVATGDPRAGTAVISGGQEVAMRSLLSFSRAQESSADAAGMSFLDHAKLSSSGLLEFMEKLQDQELLPPDRQSEFVRTHPLTRDRIDTIRNHVENSPLKDAQPSADIVEKHARMKAKLAGFLDPLSAMQTYKASDDSFAAQYARSIAQFKLGQLQQALPIVDKLIAREPNNAYLYELKGQMLFEGSRVAESIAPYQKAVELAPQSALIKTAYAHALIESGNKANLPAAVTQLEESVRIEPTTSLSWRLLATAWGQQGLEGQSAYALAEEASAMGDLKLAQMQIARAERLLPSGSPYRMRLIDLKADVKRQKSDRDS